METVTDFILGGSKITADGDCSHEIKRHLLLGRKVMTNVDSIFKSRDITLPTKVRLVKAMVFPVVTYGFESWTIKKAECWRIDAFELWCWRRLRVPWTARRLNQSIPKEINPEYSLEGQMLKLKVQYFGPWMQRADLLKKTLMLEKIKDKSRRRQHRMRWLHSITDPMNLNLSKLQETEVWGAWRAAVLRSQSGTQLSNWTTVITAFCGQLTIVNHSFLLPGGGFQYLQNSPKILFYVSVDGERGPCPKSPVLFLDGLFLLCLASAPFSN